MAAQVLMNTQQFPNGEESSFAISSSHHRASRPVKVKWAFQPITKEILLLTETAVSSGEARIGSSPEPRGV